MVAIDFHSRPIFFFPCNGSQWLLSVVWLPTFFKTLFCAQQNKETHIGLEQLEGERMMTELSFFWVNFPVEPGINVNRTWNVPWSSFCPGLSVEEFSKSLFIMTTHPFYLAGGVFRSNYLHSLCFVHWPFPCCKQHPDVLWDDRELHLHYSQANRDLAGCSAPRPARAPHPAAGERGAWASWGDTLRTLRSPNLHSSPRHTYVLGLTYSSARLWWYFGCYFCLPTLFTIISSVVTARKIRKAERTSVRGNRKQIQLESQMNCIVVALTILYGFCIIPENISNIVSVYMATGVPRRTLDILHLVSQMMLFCKSCGYARPASGALSALQQSLPGLLLLLFWGVRTTKVLRAQQWWQRSGRHHRTGAFTLQHCSPQGSIYLPNSGNTLLRLYLTLPKG